MTECAKMKLREKPGEIAIWTKIKIFYITLFFLSIITLVVNYEDGNDWLLEFHTLHLTSQFDSSVRNMNKYEMVITNITFSLARKLEILKNLKIHGTCDHFPEPLWVFERWRTAGPSGNLVWCWEQ